VPEPEWLNRTINIDTGCVFGGRLMALRWPEKELVSVPAMQTYADPVRPFMPPSASPLSAQQSNDDLLDIEDVRGKRLVATRLHRSVTVREENAAAALEVMSRFAANPKWLIYLPPTMSPSETSKALGLLEHPAEAFSYYRTNGVSTVIVEQKHMGSRAIVIVCRSDVARERFGVLKTRVASATRAPVVRSLRMPRWSVSCWRRCGQPRRIGLLGATEHRLRSTAS
jgi:protein phosphatase